MSINQLYGEILGNVTGVTWRESETINTWYSRVLNGQPIGGLLVWVMLVIYKRRSMDYRDHIADAIAATETY